MILRHGAAQFRVYGSGTLVVVKKGMDAVASTTLTSITLATSPGKMIPRRGELINEGCFYDFTNATIDEYFVLTQLDHYDKKFSESR